MTVFWLVAAALTAAVAVILIRALRQGADAVPAAERADLDFYRTQLRDIDADMAQGRTLPAEAERLRTEVSRRLLEAARQMRAAEGPLLPAASIAPAAVLVAACMLGAVALYTHLGAPGYPDLPLAGRIAAADALHESRPRQVEAEEGRMRPAPPQPDAATTSLMVQLRAAVAARPDDARGLALLAQNEARLGNLRAASDAQARLIALPGRVASADEQAGLGELLILQAGGYVSPEAEAVLVAALARDPANGTARYYSGLMFAQLGRPDRAFDLWSALLADGPPDAPWMAAVTAQIADVAARAGVAYEPPALPGPDAAAVAGAAALPEAERQAMIEGMVGQLSARLAAEGGEVEEWARLISSLAVLGRVDDARAAYDRARAAFEGLSAELGFLREAALAAGVAE